MTRITIDNDLQSRLGGLSEPVEFCDAAGHTIGFFRPAPRGSEVAVDSDGSPYSDDELRRRSQQREGRPLAEILKDLQAL